jgi:3-hydroxyisobutyrate dehydrogenase-like beta-hydroxyacid dehydrogenase
MTTRVAVLGTGLMGGAMARNLAARGWAVQGYDIDLHKLQDLKPFGVQVHANAQEAAMNCVAAIVAVVDAAQCHDVLLGPQGAVLGLPRGSTVLLCPTIAPQDTESLGEQLTAHGLHALDAPMSGGPARAQDGSMSLMVAGPAEVFTQCEALLNALSSKVFRISERLGDGARTKLVNNLLAGINLVGSAEVMGLAKALGLDLSRMLDVIEQSSGQSWIGSDRMRRAIAGDFEPRAHMTLLEKDTRLAVEAAQSAGFAGLLGPLAAGAFKQASADGLAAQDDGALFKQFQPKA